MPAAITLRFRCRAVTASLLLACAALAASAAERPWFPSEWGADDQRGAANRITPERTLAALRLARTGRIYPLAQPFRSDMLQAQQEELLGTARGLALRARHALVAVAAGAKARQRQRGEVAVEHRGVEAFGLTDLEARFDEAVGHRLRPARHPLVRRQRPSGKAAVVRHVLLLAGRRRLCGRAPGTAPGGRGGGRLWRRGHRAARRGPSARTTTLPCRAPTAPAAGPARCGDAAAARQAGTRRTAAAAVEWVLRRRAWAVVVDKTRGTATEVMRAGAAVAIHRPTFGPRRASCPRGTPLWLP
jgi:hypothetical protein